MFGIVIKPAGMSKELQETILKTSEVLWEMEKPIKYYKVTAYTPYVGEELEDFIATADEDELREFAECLCSDCAAEWAPDFEDWYEEDGYDSAEEYEEYYYSQCGVHITEVSKEVYEKESMPKWPFELIKEGPGWDET